MDHTTFDNTVISSKSCEVQIGDTAVILGIMDLDSDVESNVMEPLAVADDAKKADTLDG